MGQSLKIRADAQKCRGDMRYQERVSAAAETVDKHASPPPRKLSYQRSTAFILGVR